MLFHTQHHSARTGVNAAAVIGLALLLCPAPARAADAKSLPATVSSAEMTLRQDMRRLWSDHVIWTRDYIVAAVANSGDQQASAARLLKNQEHIGAAVAAYYGKPAGDKLTALLKDHIMIAVDVIAAAKAHDDANYQAADKKWQQNAEDIATFLSGANPNWPKATLVSMMQMHLSTTTKEVVARLHGQWNDDVAAFDEVYAHILHMADALSDGIVKQFPEKFK